MVGTLIKPSASMPTLTFTVYFQTLYELWVSTQQLHFYESRQTKLHSFSGPLRTFYNDCVLSFGSNCLCLWQQAPPSNNGIIFFETEFLQTVIWHPAFSANTLGTSMTTRSCFSVSCQFIKRLAVVSMAQFILSYLQNHVTESSTQQEPQGRNLSLDSDLQSSHLSSCFECICLLSLFFFFDLATVLIFWLNIQGYLLIYYGQRNAFAFAVSLSS